MSIVANAASRPPVHVIVLRLVLVSLGVTLGLQVAFVTRAMPRQAFGLV